MLSIVHGARQQPLGIFSATRAPEEYATYRQRAARDRAAAAPLLPAWLRRSGTDRDRARAPAARPARRGRRTARGARVHRPAPQLPIAGDLWGRHADQVLTL